MKISIIIPVYNAANFITQAVNSAMRQPETGEVILVEDGSIDNSLDVCRKLSNKYNKVLLYGHKNGENRGPGASRNLGIKKSKFDYIAFLDADDFFLPSRFLSTKKAFASDPYCEGVYEAAGIYFDNEQAEIRWRESNMASVNVTTLSEYVLPEELFEILIKGEIGYFSIIGLTIKKSVIDKVGYMNEKLRIHQDTDFIMRLSAVARLLPGSIDIPVVIRRVHEHNRISAPRSKVSKFKAEILMWLSIYNWLDKNGFQAERKLAFRSIIKLIYKSVGQLPKAIFETS
jgi:glycosyltransferase involved in cell wall biosynthesis